MGSADKAGATGGETVATAGAGGVGARAGVGGGAGVWAATGAGSRVGAGAGAEGRTDEPELGRDSAVADGLITGVSEGVGRETGGGEGFAWVWAADGAGRGEDAGAFGASTDPSVP